MASTRLRLLLLALLPVCWTAGSAVHGFAWPQEIASPDVRPPAADIAGALQSRYERIRDFTASFTQTHEGGVLRRTSVESGTVAIKKPGRMRWDYSVPQKKVVVSDGRTMFMYFPEDRQVMTFPVPEQDEATSAVLFLLGRGDVVRDFTVTWVDGGGDEEYALRLDPRARQAEFDWLEVTASRSTLQIRTLTAGDAQGGRSIFAFTNFKENVGLADKMFEFSVPRGTEVIKSGTSR